MDHNTYVIDFYFKMKVTAFIQQNHISNKYNLSKIENMYIKMPYIQDSIEYLVTLSPIK